VQFIILFKVEIKFHLKEKEFFFKLKKNQNKTKKKQNKKQKRKVRFWGQFFPKT